MQFLKVPTDGLIGRNIHPGVTEVHRGFGFLFFLGPFLPILPGLIWVMKFSIRPGHAFSQEPPNRLAHFFKLFSCEVGLPNGKFPRRSVAVKENYFQSPFLRWFFELSSSTGWNIVAPGSVPKRYDGREVRPCVPKRKNCVSVSSSPCSDRAQWWHS